MADERNRLVAFGLALGNVFDASTTVLLIMAVAPSRCLIADKAKTRLSVDSLGCWLLSRLSLVQLCGPERVLSLRLGLGVVRHRVYMTVAVYWKGCSV